MKSHYIVFIMEEEVIDESEKSSNMLFNSD